MTLTLTDLFCGAGGSSSGAEQVPGVRVRMAANHWSLAIETHNTNLPHADHDCADVSQVDPRRYPRTDILWASPECTNHSQARGKRRVEPQPDLFGDVLPDEAVQRSRATMWDVVRFTEHHHYRAVLVENVVDVYHWAPFRAWLMAMDCLGYDHQVVWLNSMHAQAAGLPAPQSRDRMYVVFWRKGDRRPDVDRWTRPRAWCPACACVIHAVQAFKRLDRPAWGRYRQQYLYRCPRPRCHTVVEPGWLPAAAAIDWALRGERIGDRAKPLAAKTRARIEAGLRKYARPVHLEHGGNQYDAADPKHPQHGHERAYMRAWPVSDPLKVIHTAPTKALAYAPGMLVPVEGRDGKDASSVLEALRTQTARNETALLVPAGGTWNDDARSAQEPFRTRTTRDAEALVVPLRTNGVAGSVDEPIKTVVAGNVGHALVVPLRNHNTAKETSDVLDAVVAAGNHHALVMRNNTARGNPGQMCTPVHEELRTITTAGHQSLVRWDHLVIDYNGPARQVCEPLPTQTTVEGDGVLDPAVEVDDCYFRMLEPHEIKLAMAFEPDYVLLGNKREQVRLSGNAVTPPAARDLIGAVAEALS